MSAYVQKRAQRHRRRRESYYVLLWSGEKGLDMYNSWTIEKGDDRKKPAVIFGKFENQLEPKTSHRIHRYTLQGMRQDPHEPVDDFISRIKNLAVKCQFRDNAEVDWGGHRPSPVGTANNATEFQCSITG